MTDPGNDERRGSNAVRPAVGLKKKIIFSSVAVLAALALVYGGFLFWRAFSAYHYLKSGRPGWQGQVFKADPALGFAPLGRSQAAQIGPGFKTPVKFDAQGFRIAAGEDADRQFRRPLVLALGCSYTFGHGVPAEKTFSYLVAEHWNGSELNAGLPTYGLAQMILLAQKLIPQYRPEYVLVQYSTWLAGRGIWPMGISYPGKLPSPYFTESAGKLVVQPPLFRPKIFELPISQYRETPASFLDALSFLKNAGLPLLLHDDCHVAVMEAKLLSGTVPKPVPAERRQDVIETVYGRIGELCAQNGSRMVVVILHDPEADDPYLKPPTLKGALMVNPDPALRQSLKDQSADSYYRTYALVVGAPPEQTDRHPNELANRIIADQIIRAIEN